MFGLFGKSQFEREMAELENQKKSLGAKLVSAMQSINLRAQSEILGLMIQNFDEQIACCRRHGRHDRIQQIEELRQQAIRLHG